MMQMWGMGGFPLIGLLPLVILGGLLYFFRDRLRIGKKGANSPEIAQPAVPELFRLAKGYAGVLTVSDIVSELNLAPKEAEALLDQVTDGQRVDMEVDSNGVVRYVFREFL